MRFSYFTGRVAWRPILVSLLALVLGNLMGLATVSRWDEEHHEIAIQLVDGRVSDVETRVRSTRQPAEPSP